MTNDYYYKSRFMHWLIENRSTSRIKRLSEHIRKETISSNPVIGQGDAIVNKNLTHSYQDLRKERGKSDIYEPSYLEGNTIDSLFCEKRQINKNKLTNLLLSSTQCAHSYQAERRHDIRKLIVEKELRKRDRYVFLSSNRCKTRKIFDQLVRMYYNFGSFNKAETF